MKLMNIGYNNMINADRIISVVSPESAPVKRMVQQAKEKGTLVDATHGRKTMSVFMMDSDHVVLSYLPAQTLLARFEEELAKE